MRPVLLHFFRRSVHAGERSWLIAAFTAFLFLGCAPPRSPVTGSFVHPSLNVAALESDAVVVYGYRGLEGTLKQRQTYDQSLHTAFVRSAPAVRTVSPALFQAWLWDAKKAETLGAALDQGPEALPYDQLKSVGQRARYLFWGTVSRADKHRWRDLDEEQVSYCVGWRLVVRYAIADLVERRLVAEAQVELDDHDCQVNPRSNSLEGSTTVRQILGRALFDAASDAAVDGVFGTYPEGPSPSALLDASARHFFHLIKK